MGLLVMLKCIAEDNAHLFWLNFVTIAYLQPTSFESTRNLKKFAFGCSFYQGRVRQWT